MLDLVCTMLDSMKLIFAFLRRRQIVDARVLTHMKSSRCRDNFCDLFYRLGKNEEQLRREDTILRGKLQWEKNHWEKGEPFHYERIDVLHNHSFLCFSQRPTSYEVEDDGSPFFSLARALKTGDFSSLSVWMSEWALSGKDIPKEPKSSQNQTAILLCSNNG